MQDRQRVQFFLDLSNFKVNSLQVSVLVDMEYLPIIGDFINADLLHGIEPHVQHSKWKVVSREWVSIDGVPTLRFNLHESF